jgi:Tfp pilus assembly protein PilN
MSGHLNLSRRPFINTRPVTRVALLLWIVGGLLLLGNVTLFYGYLSGSSEARAELAGKREAIESERRKIGQLQTRLAGLELEEQNEQVEFLNRKIAERAFSWSLLFDRLAEVMPDDVRLLQLQPASIGGDDRRRGSRPSGSATTRGRRPEGSSDRVPLSLQVEARNDEALSQLVDSMFAHPAFDDPDFTRETRDEGDGDSDVVRFDLRVTYIPGIEARTGTGQEPAMEVVEEETPPATPPAGEPVEENESGIE